MSQMQTSVQTYIRNGGVQERLNSLLGERAGQFTASLMSVVNSNPLLQECQPESVVKAAITAAAMNLPINQNLGFAYIIPYNNSKKTIEKYLDAKGVERTRNVFTKVYEAQFQMGYKGFIQLAQRSGHYKTINSTDVREGELVKEDRLSGELEFAWIDDDKEREKLPIIGYVAYFKLSTGFEKSLYMSIDKLKKHAKKYSKSYAKGYGLWAEDDGFEFMSKKTVLKLLISRFGPMTTEMEKAILADQSTVDDDFKYIDNDHDDKTTPPKSNGIGADAGNDTTDDVVEGEVVNDSTDQSLAEDVADKTPAPKTLQEKIADEKAKRGIK